MTEEPRPPAGGWNNEPPANRPGSFGDLPAAPPVEPVPQYGYQVPTSAYPTGTYPGDPLVTPPGEGFGGWWGRLMAILRRDWRRIFAITLSTSAIPLAVLILISSLAAPKFSSVTNANGTKSVHVEGGSIPLLVVALLLAAVLGGYLTAVANAASVFSVTRNAAGAPVSLGDSLRYGFRHGTRLWGWSLLFGLLVLVGTCACILPGLYLGLAGCLYAPLALYERGSGPIGTSFSMINKNFGAALGRMALLLLIVYIARLVLSIPAALVGLGSHVAGTVVTAIVDVITAPLAVIVTLGTVVLYAELRAKLVPTTVQSLSDALGA
jgi:hypothetical protein